MGQIHTGKIDQVHGIRWECGAPRHPARQTSAAFVSILLCFTPSATSSSHCHSVLPISLLFPKSCHAPPTHRHPRRDGGVGRCFSSSIPPVQPALSCRCPSRRKSPGRVGSHKRHPQHLAHHCVLSSRGVGGRGATEGRARATSAGGEGAQQGACERTYSSVCGVGAQLGRACMHVHL